LTAHTFDLVCLPLSSRFRCISVDSRGHGDSAWAQDREYTPHARVADVEALVEVLDLRDFVLVGMSMGGGTAIGYAGRHSARLRGLVLVDTGAPPEEPMARPGARRIRDFNNGPGRFADLDEAIERSLAFNPSRDRRLLRRSLLHALRQEPDGSWRWKYDREGLGNRGPDASPARIAEQRESLTRITCPTLVLRGDRSDMFTDEDAEHTVSLLPNGRWARIDNAGHTIQGDNPRGMLDAMRPFLKEIEA
jgi:pimeloyl-ACP methyl ester carboxylesterase